LAPQQDKQPSAVSSTPDDEARLRAALAQVATGGAPAERGMRELVRLLESRVLSIFLRNSMDEATAHDLAQETFVRIAKAAAGFRGDSKVNTWVHTIATNLLRDHTRRPKTEVNLDDDGWAAQENRREFWVLPGFEEQQLSAALVACVRRMFGRFAAHHPEHAEALRFSALNEADLSEVAMWLGRTLHATSEYLSQCRKKLAPYLEKCRELLPA
jgi:RNA polymerase sigma factor (sigma-70 family)